MLHFWQTKFFIEIVQTLVKRYLIKYMDKSLPFSLR